MNFWNNLGLTRKIVIFICTMLAVILLLSANSLYMIRLLSDNAHAVKSASGISSLMLAREIDHLIWINSLQKFVLDPGQTALSIQADPRKCGLGQWYYGAGREEAVAKFPGLEAELGKMEGAHVALHESAAHIYRLRTNGDAATALQTFNDVSMPSVRAVQAVLKNVTSMMMDEQVSTFQEFDASADFSKIVTAGLILFGVAVAITMGVLISRIITSPVLALARFAHNAANGNLDESISMQRADEIGSLAANLQRLVSNIKSMIIKADDKTREAEQSAAQALEAVQAAEAAQQAAERAKSEGMLAAAMQLESVVSSLSLAFGRLSAQVVDSERGAGVQAGRINETAVAMEEMTATILKVARTAEEASNFSSAAKKKAEEGAVVVQAAVSSIQNVQAVSLAMKEDIAKLADQAEAISNIMIMISDIADQTNLLALNAAIEAARAGEAGRGFAVVADEVRKLAEKTLTSTTNVGQSISGIQKEVSESIGQVEKVANLIQTVVMEATRSREMLSEIESMANGTADRVRTIATASEEQSATCEEINRAIAEINTIANRTAGAMNEAHATVSGLTTQVHNLNTLISDMQKL